MLAGLAALATQRVLAGYHGEVAAVRSAPDLRVPVLVARWEVPMGARLTEADVEVVRVAPALAADLPSAVGDVVGRVVTERLLPHEPIRTGRLAPAGRGSAIEAIVPAGLRALSLNLSRGAAGSGMIAPGDFVDVISTLLREEDLVRAESKILLRSARVLSIGEIVVSTEPESGEEVQQIVRAQVTLEVTPREAQLLVFAQRRGPLHLALIGAAEPGTHPARGLTRELP